MSDPIKILIIVTSHAVMGGEPATPTGLWFEELTTPYYALADAGAVVDIASIRGGPVPIDPRSQRAAGENPASVERFLADPRAMAKLSVSWRIEAVDASHYDAVFLPGGHGTMFDLPGSTRLATIVSATLARGAVVAAVCHGPAGLVSAVDETGKPIVAGRRVSGFTNSEEEAAGLTNAVPFLLETRLRDLGATYVSGPDFRPFAVADGNLVTGQNPASSEEVARLMLERVQANRAGQ
jgi:putative intracellular protease/amidase